jgi:hypothetical protein
MRSEYFSENFEKRGVVEKKGEEETKFMPHAPVQVMAKAHIASGKVC